MNKKGLAALGIIGAAGLAVALVLQTKDKESSRKVPPPTDTQVVLSLETTPRNIAIQHVNIDGTVTYLNDYGIRFTIDDNLFDAGDWWVVKNTKLYISAPKYALIPNVSIYKFQKWSSGETTPSITVNLGIENVKRTAIYVAQKPTVTLDKKSGKAGDPLRITCKDLTPSDRIRLVWNAEPYAYDLGIVGSDGNLVVTSSVPAISMGTYKLLLQVRSGKWDKLVLTIKSGISFTITSPPLPPEPAPPTLPLTITGLNISGTTKVGYTIMIETNIQNDTNEAIRCLIATQLTDPTGVALPAYYIETVIAGLASFKFSVNFIPKFAGKYVVEASVFSDYPAKGGETLADPKIVYLDVTA